MSESGELVSVIMPVFNGGNHLMEAARSVLTQTYTRLELILIDDGSTDNSRELMLELLEDQRVICLYLPINRGAAHARNEGIQAASGRFIAFLDTDDIWFPDKLEKQIPFMMKEKAVLSFTAYEWMNQNGIPTGRTMKAPSTLTYHQLLRFNAIGCLTAIYDTAVSGKVLMPETAQRHDWGLWLKLTQKFGHAAGLNLVLANYRISPASLSANKWKSARYNWIILREHQQLPLHKACWYFSQFLLFKGLKYMGLLHI